jgi:regulatory protein
MMNQPQTITGFKKEGKRFPKIVVMLDGQPWATLDPETVVREHLATGQALTEKRRREVLFADEVVRARKAAAGHAAHAPKTRLELEHFLMEKGFGPLSRRKAIDLLGEAGVVNDEAVAGRVVRNRRRKGGVGPLRLQAELRHRGVAPSIAERQVSAQMEGADLAAECLDLARKVRPRYEPLETQAQRAKLAAFLMRRGYPSAHVWKAVRHLLAENGIDAGDDDTPPGDE